MQKFELKQDTGDESHFPVRGLRVRVYWPDRNKWLPATVKRWSKTHKQWVLKYDKFKDSVYETTPVSQWRFFQ